MIIKAKNVPNLVLPKFGTEKSACLDIIATTHPKIVGKEFSTGLYESIDYIEYGTNLYMTPQDREDWNGIMGPGARVIIKDQFFIDIRPRSSISKYNLILANSPATGDGDYTGEYKIRFKYIIQPEDLRMIFRSQDTIDNSHPEIYTKVNLDKIYKCGDKICQMRPSIRYPVEFQVVDELKETARSSGGFGSTGN